MAKEWQYNPICLMLPPASDDVIDELCESFKKNGQQVPIQLDAEGRVLDGRNRILAYDRHIFPWKLKTQKWVGRGTVERYADFVYEHNVLRRQLQLNPIQRAALYEKMRTDNNLKRGNGCPNLDNLKQTAEKIGVSERTLKTARAVNAKASPADRDAVIAGTKTAKEALEAAEPEIPDIPDDEPMKDQLGNVMPKLVQDAFERVQELTDVKQAVDKARRQIEALVESKDPIATFIRWNQLRADFKNVASAIHFAYPYCVCPYCNGAEPRDCKACEGAGWMPREVYNQIVPDELKWKKGK